MIDPLIRRTNALNRSVNRIQSSQILSLSRELSYATFTTSTEQDATSGIQTFLIWGSAIRNSTQDDGISLPFEWDAGGSVIKIPRQGYYLFTLGLVLVQPVPTTFVTQLYVNDELVQQTQQPAGLWSILYETTSTSFSVFLEENDSVQFAIVPNDNTSILSTNPDTLYEVAVGISPVLHITKVV